MQIKSKTVNEGGKYHTTMEVFIPFDNLVKNDYMVQNGMIHVGVAWKTNGDMINNGAINNGGADAWWMPKGTLINGNPACVDATGMYLPSEYNK